MSIIIKLTQGQETIISDEDADLAEYKWHARRCHFRGDKQMYQACRQGKVLHRVILMRMLGREIGTMEWCDHKNGNPLDNRRENLRLATPQQNNANKPLRPDNKTGYKGVIQDKYTGRYFARITVNGKAKQRGTFATAKEAHVAYCEMSREIHGEFANFGSYEGEV